MSSSFGISIKLNDCGCCEGIATSTPVDIENRPGLNAIVYRAGTHAEFKRSMLAKLASASFPALQALTSRDEDDFSIALIDGWATIADVLTFYQERIANESYLRTATERLSILELARLIDYQLRPGVAASAYLAFTIEDAPGAFGQALVLGTSVPGTPQYPPVVTIGAAVKVQSVPGPGETAQSYETVEEIEARAEWNAMRPRLTQRHPITKDIPQLYFAGVATALKTGDGLILFPDDKGDPVFRQISEVIAQSDQNRTLVKLLPLAVASPAAGNLLFPFVGPAFSTGFGSFINKKISQPDLNVFAVTGKFVIQDLFANLNALKPPPPGVFATRARAAIFGHNAPAFNVLPVAMRKGQLFTVEEGNPPVFTTKFDPPIFTESTWVDNLNVSNYASGEDVFLDSTYPGITKDTFVALKNSSGSKVYQVTAAREVSKSDFTLTAKVTELTLNSTEDFNLFSIRGTTVYGQSELLPLARLPIDTPVSGRVIDLNGFVGNLYKGQKLIFCGERADLPGVRVCELSAIESVEQVLEVEGATQITLQENLAFTYIRNTVTIDGNVALATHGETVQEVLGGGNATQPFQRFQLKQPPLTYVSSPTPSGTETTLTVRVNDLLWKEVPTFFGSAPTDRIYVTRLDDAGNTTVIFGDGKTGARLPTGDSNVNAKYRKGIGEAGLVKADQLSQLLVRPLGVKGVTNPMAASGAQDPEKLADARRNVPLTVLTLGRVVSLLDYEDFSRGFAGIGKAFATFTWNGETRQIFVTVAASGGNDLPEDSPLLTNLVKALTDSGDPAVSLVVIPSTPLFFRVSAKVKIDPVFLQEKVFADIEAKLRDAFSFENRDFGQPVTLSEVIAVMQNVPGVMAVDVDSLYRVRDDPPGSLIPRLPVAAPRQGATTLIPAEMLILDPSPINLGVLP